MSGYGEDEVIDDFDNKRIVKAVVTAEGSTAQEVGLWGYVQSWLRDALQLPKELITKACY